MCFVPPLQLKKALLGPKHFATWSSLYTMCLTLKERTIKYLLLPVREKHINYIQLHFTLAQAPPQLNIQTALHLRLHYQSRETWYGNNHAAKNCLGGQKTARNIADNGLRGHFCGVQQEWQVFIIWNILRSVCWHWKVQLQSPIPARSPGPIFFQVKFRIKNLDLLQGLLIVKTGSDPSS